MLSAVDEYWQFHSVQEVPHKFFRLINYLQCFIINLLHFQIQSHSVGHSLKSGAETRILGPWDSRPCDSGLWDPDTDDPGTGSVGLATLRPRILRTGPWEFNCDTDS